MYTSNVVRYLINKIAISETTLVVKSKESLWNFEMDGIAWNIET